ncbi:hypothetical protein SAMN02745194_04519 [Roseomonas rosea]|uniref:Uncharacterized protein n=1 Tax=Muricoccus roseus TaxID=198092 RepID=A0A1M6QU43_9PROT|nr:hypothetical protein [Roseomonas rosea]SHK23802.1 hypothetical protein SAMN02745194_04519 [Roseomonas rosea]
MAKNDPNGKLLREVMEDRAAAPTPAQGGEAEAVEALCQRIERLYSEEADGAENAGKTALPLTLQEAVNRLRALPAPSAPGAEVMRLREVLEVIERQSGNVAYNVAQPDCPMPTREDIVQWERERKDMIRAALAPDAAPEEGA